MTKRFLALLAVSAALVAFSGLHLEIASGRALDRLPPGDARLLQTGTRMTAATVDRTTKTDRREVAANGTADEGRTITFQHPDLPSTTVAARVWETAGAAKARPAARDPKAPAQKPKRMVGCEGVVSVLTEVAKHLDAGRCIT